MDGAGLADKQPIKREMKKWKDWTFEVEYYSIYSSGRETENFFESYSTNENSIIFKSKDDLQVFNVNEVQLLLDTNHIHVRRFKIDTFQSKVGISFSQFDMNKKGDYRQKAFILQQAFVKANP